MNILFEDERGVFMKVGMVSLGCSKNLVDSEMVLGLLKASDIEIVANPKIADVIIVNTCGFIQSAKEEAISTILEMAQYKTDNKKLMVIGCLSTRYKDQLEVEMPEVDRFISISEYPKFAEIFNEVVNAKQIDKESSLCFNQRIVSTPKHWAYVRIADGCDNFCTFCAIPLIRGRYQSRTIEDVVGEVKNLVRSGKKEIVLISQDSTQFGKDNGEKIEDLLLSLVKIEDLKMLRILYLYPSDISDEYIQIVKNNPVIAPYFDIPVQHASNKILKFMNRRDHKDTIYNCVKKIRQEIPNAIIRTTVIVGFPFEEEQDFNELKDMINDLEFDRLGAFKYSPEDDTPSATFSHQVCDDVKEQRYQEIMKIQQKFARQSSQKFIGTVQHCFVEGFDYKMNMNKARNYAYAGDNIDGWIYIKGDKIIPVGTEVDVNITDCYIYDLIGELV